jgi:double-stranded uracil-DNA glycosylase
MKPSGEDGALPDLLRPGLDVVFVGTAAGRRSANVGAYYAGRGNRFWQTLADVGLTPRRYDPSEYREVLDLGIGFTDMSKSGVGMDHQIAAHMYDRRAFETKMRKYIPRFIAFTGKKAASLWLARPTHQITLGLQSKNGDFPEVFVLPSTSGAASRYWDPRHWKKLASRIKSRQPSKRSPD